MCIADIVHQIVVSETYQRVDVFFDLFILFLISITKVSIYCDAHDQGLYKAAFYVRTQLCLEPNLNIQFDFSEHSLQTVSSTAYFTFLQQICFWKLTISTTVISYSAPRVLEYGLWLLATEVDSREASQCTILQSMTCLPI